MNTTPVGDDCGESARLMPETIDLRQKGTKNEHKTWPPKRSAKSACKNAHKSACKKSPIYVMRIKHGNHNLLNANSIVRTDRDDCGESAPFMLETNDHHAGGDFDLAISRCDADQTFQPQSPGRELDRALIWEPICKGAGRV